MVVVVVVGCGHHGCGSGGGHGGGRGAVVEAVVLMVVEVLVMTAGSRPQPLEPTESTLFL